MCAGFDLQERGNYSTKTIEIPDEDINSGDMFCILRLDGLDPLISWGTASPCGHTTMALRIRGILYIVESQTKSSYWPTNFVQKTPYKEWLKLAEEADYNVVYLPLGEAQRAKFQVRRESHCLCLVTHARRALCCLDWNRRTRTLLSVSF